MIHGEMYEKIHSSITSIIFYSRFPADVSPISALIDYVAAPMPLLIGLHKSLEERARKIWGEELVLVDLDNDEMQVSYCFIISIGFLTDIVNWLR